MKRLPYMVLAGVLGIGGCMTDYIRLTGPPGSTRESRNEEMRQCRSKASVTQRPLDAQEKAALKGRSTTGFLEQSNPLGPLRSVTDRDGYPATTLVRFTPPEEVSDRYVLCLLERGYRWEKAKGQ